MTMQEVMSLPTRTPEDADYAPAGMLFILDIHRKQLRSGTNTIEGFKKVTSANGWDWCGYDIKIKRDDRVLI